MKIGFDVAQTCDQRAGCGWYADSLVRAMVGIAPEHHYFLYHQYGGWINPSTASGTRIDSPSVTPTFLDVDPLEAARIWRHPEELAVKTGAPDIVHANSFQALRVPGAKLVFTVYDVSFWAVPGFTTEANRLACQTGLLQALGNADGFIFISQSTHNEFERILPGWLERSGKPSAVTLLGPRNETPARPASSTAPEYWLAVGSLEPRKNYETLLDAMELYWKKSSRRLALRIAGGSGWKSEDLKRRIQEMNRRGLVTHLGYVPDEQLPGLYAGAEALIFPSWYEGFGLPVLEAMGAGCPVICSANTSLREVGGDAAIYVHPEDPASITNAMLSLEATPGEHTRRGQASLTGARRFGWEQTARSTLAFYAELLHRSGAKNS